MLASQSAAVLAKHRDGKAVAAGIVGLALGAAIADSGKRDRYIYGPPPPAYGPPPPFSPAAGVICYQAQRACYNDNGMLSAKWTRRVYGM